MDVVVVGIGLLLAAVVGLGVGWLAGDGSSKHWLLSYAGAAELFGVLLVASPELVPRVKLAWSGVKSGLRQIKNYGAAVILKLRRLLGKEPERKPIERHLSDAVGTSDTAMAIHTSPTGDLRQQIDFLIRRDRATQERFQALENRVGGLPDRWRNEIEAQSEELQEDFQDALHGLEERHMRARLIGLSLLVVGIILNTWGNLL